MKPAVFLLSGLLCDEVVWQSQVAALSRTEDGVGRDVRTVSFQGFDSIAAMAAHVLAQAPARFALAGHSMGGRVALEVMRQAPERVERLALLDTGYEGAGAGEAERRAVLVDQALAEGIDAIAATWGLPMLAPAHRQRADLVEPILAMVGRMSGEIYAGQTRALLGRPDATPQLSQIRCPTLILCGEEDGWSPPERHRRLAELVPGSTLVLIPECGHMSTMEQPEAVNAALLQWLA